VATAGDRLAAAGLVPGTSGNLSARAGDLVAATPSGLRCGGLRAEQVTVIDLDGNVVDGDLLPTS
jgi:L-fuculose-phosphate aldolase